MSIDDVLDAVASEYGLSVDDMKSRKRDALTMEARQMAMFLLGYMDGVSIVEVAYVMGTSASVASYGIEKMYDLLDCNKIVSERYENIKRKLHEIA